MASRYQKKKMTVINRLSTSLRQKGNDANIALAKAIGADDLNLLPGPGETGAHLLNPWVLLPGIGINLFEDSDFGGVILAKSRAERRGFLVEGCISSS